MKRKKIIQKPKVPTVLSVAVVVSLGVLAGLAVAQGDLPTFNFEAEAGDLAGGASLASDDAAAGGSYVSFFEQTIPGPVGQCGLAGEVFCENFEAGPAANRLRSGDFDSSKISAARLSGTYDNGGLSWVQRALIPAGCRSGSVTNPLPPDDTLICNPTAVVNSRHGLTAVTVQNYGDNYYRVNQPFDFAGRTGVIRFDASIHHMDGLWGAAAVTLTDEALPSTSIIAENGNGAPPRNGLVLHFNFFCRNNQENSTMPSVRLYSNYTETSINDANGQSDWCDNPGVLSRRDRLNRVELRISQNRLEVWASDFSNDGVTFGPLKKMYTSPALNLPFTRGWFSFGGHNHASIKYGGPASINVLWDNIAFDGPALANPRVYQIPDNGAPVSGGMALGHAFRNRDEQIMPALTFSNVQKTGMTTAKLSFNSWAEHYFNPWTERKLFYRLNGGAWHAVAIPQAMVNDLSARGAARANHLIDVNIAELNNGNNTIQFASDGMHNGYQSFVSNIDLQLN